MKELNKRKARLGSWKAVANELGVSQQYVHDVKELRRKPGDKLLKPLGLVLTESYVKLFAKKARIR